MTEYDFFGNTYGPEAMDACLQSNSFAAGEAVVKTMLRSAVLPATSLRLEAELARAAQDDVLSWQSPTHVLVIDALLETNSSIYVRTVVALDLHSVTNMEVETGALEDYFPLQTTDFSLPW